MRHSILSFLVLTFCFAPSFVTAQSHAGRMDTDGILSPGEIPNPRINYDKHPAEQPARGCAGYRTSNLRPPRVEIYETSSKGGDKVRVTGAVEGVCLAEANLYEDGRPQRPIAITTVDSFRRFEFEITTKLHRDPEIRVYNAAGARDIAHITLGERESRDDGDY